MTTAQATSIPGATDSDQVYRSSSRATTSTSAFGSFRDAFSRTLSPNRADMGMGRHPSFSSESACPSPSPPLARCVQWVVRDREITRVGRRIIIGGQRWKISNGGTSKRRTVTTLKSDIPRFLPVGRAAKDTLIYTCTRRRVLGSKDDG